MKSTVEAMSSNTLPRGENRLDEAHRHGSLNPPRHVLFQPWRDTDAGDNGLSRAIAQAILGELAQSDVGRFLVTGLAQSDLGRFLVTGATSRKARVMLREDEWEIIKDVLRRSEEARRDIKVFSREMEDRGLFIKFGDMELTECYNERSRSSAFFKYLKAKMENAKTGTDAGQQRGGDDYISQMSPRVERMDKTNEARPGRVHVQVGGAEIRVDDGQTGTVRIDWEGKELQRKEHDGQWMVDGDDTRSIWTTSTGKRSERGATWDYAMTQTMNSGFASGTPRTMNWKGVREGRERRIPGLPRPYAVGRTGKAPAPVPKSMLKALGVVTSDDEDSSIDPDLKLALAQSEKEAETQAAAQGHLEIGRGQSISNPPEKVDYSQAIRKATFYSETVTDAEAEPERAWENFARLYAADEAKTRDLTGWTADVRSAVRYSAESDDRPALVDEGRKSRKSVHIYASDTSSMSEHSTVADEERRRDDGNTGDSTGTRNSLGYLGQHRRQRAMWNEADDARDAETISASTHRRRGQAEAVDTDSSFDGDVYEDALERPSKKKHGRWLSSFVPEKWRRSWSLA